MTSITSVISQALPGSTPIQKVATGLVSSTTNAGLCALTGHLFSVVMPTAGAFFGATAGLLGLGIASYCAFKNSNDDLLDRVSKAVVGYFVGGALGYLVTNAVGLTISVPASLLFLSGPILMTTLGMLALKVASSQDFRGYRGLGDLASGIREFFGQ